MTKENAFQTIKGKLYYVKLFFTDREKLESILYWGKQRKTSFGKLNKDKTFFVIRKNPKATGLLSCYLSALGQLKEIADKPYIPVEDMQMHFYPLVHNPEDEGKPVNAWEYYFDQFAGVGMNEVLKSKNVILSKGTTVPSGMCFFDDTLIDVGFIQEWAPYDEKNFRLKPELQARFRETAESVLGNKRILGVMIREGYIVLDEGRSHHSELYNKHPGIHNHPVQPSVDELIDTISTRLRDWACDAIFAVCETSYILDCLSRAFPGRIFFTNRRRRIVSDLTLESFHEAAKQFQENYPVVDSNIDYLEEIYLLSQCTSMISGKCSGSVVAGLWNRNRYEHLEFFSKGHY